jgi:hypothetical protein
MIVFVNFKGLLAGLQEVRARLFNAELGMRQFKIIATIQKHHLQTLFSPYFSNKTTSVTHESPNQNNFIYLIRDKKLIK